MITGEDGEKELNLIDWASTKQKRVSLSSYGAEITKCADDDYRGLYMKENLK